MSTLEQERAANALKRVDRLAHQLKGGAQEKYRAYVDRLGPAIVMNGLGQALASERAARTKEHEELYESLKGWLCRANGVYPADSDLLDAITQRGEREYLHAQAEALAWLEWHKKFCRARFPKGDGA